jgi:phage terminase Nu1 subunit (DNA packaging protein)
MSDDPLIMNKLGIAKLLGVDERSVSRWQGRADDPLPVLSRGRRGYANEYDAHQVHEWSLRQALKDLGIGGEGEVVDYEYERARLTREQADSQALKNAQLRKELAPVTVIEWTLGKVGAQISAILDQIPLKVKRRVPRLSSAEAEIIKREVIKAQNMAAKVTVDIDEYLDDQRDEGNDSGDSPARPSVSRKTRAASPQ